MLNQVAQAFTKIVSKILTTNLALTPTVVVATLFTCSGTAMGQAGVSSMSSSALRSGVALKFDEIRVEELINFHRHEIPLPTYDQRIGVDTRVGEIDGKKVFQIGFATHRDVVPEFRVPLNLVLVIDRSGSMSGDRIRKVKEALQQLVKKLHPRDLVSIVTYSSDATVCLEATRASDIRVAAKAIESIQAGGSTNLNAGLMLGYQLAKQQYDSERANRVILLTDGIANQGVTDEQQIARQSKSYNDLGIGLSTIGLGGNFNRSLLRELADAGRGAIHFVADASDIRKVFVDEFDSLLSPAARDLTLTIRVPAGEKLPKIYGYRTQAVTNGIQLSMENMSYGATQIVVGKFASKPVRLEIEFEYFDSCTSKQVRVTETVEAYEIKRADHVLKKNYSIARVAQAIRQAAKHIESENYEKASKRLQTAVGFAREHFAIEADVDVDRVCNIAGQRQAAIAPLCRATRKTRL